MKQYSDKSFNIGDFSESDLKLTTVFKIKVNEIFAKN